MFIISGNLMEIGTRKLDEEIIQLKKSLKKKNRAEIWQRVLQFYNKHHPILNNLQIIKLIKISLSCLKIVIHSQLRKLKKICIEMETSEEIMKEDKRLEVGENLMHNFSLMERILVSYTIVLQTFLQSSSQPFFNFVFNNRFEVPLYYKDLMFEPKLDKQENQVTNKQSQYQIRKYLNFYCRYQLIFLQIMSLLAPHEHKVRTLTKIQPYMWDICKTSLIFSFKQMQMEIMKVNILRQQQSPKKQASSIQKINYEFPLENIQRLYRVVNDRSYTAFNYYLKLMLVYALNMLISQHMFQMGDKPISEHQIFILINELLVFIKQKSISQGLNKKIIESLRPFYLLYDRQLLEKEEIFQIIKRYSNIDLKPHNTRIQQITKAKIGQAEETNEELSYLEEKQKKTNYHSFCSPILSFMVGSSEKNKNEYVDIALQRLNWDFQLIFESDSDQNGEISHIFENRTRALINNQQSQFHLPRLNHRPLEKAKDQSSIKGIKFKEQNMMEYQRVQQKLSQLSSNIVKLREQSKSALKKLRKQYESAQNYKRVKSFDQDVCDREVNLNYKNQIGCDNKRKSKKIQDRIIHNKPKNILKIKSLKKDSPADEVDKRSPLMSEFKEKFSFMSQKVVLDNTHHHTKNI